MRPVRKAEQSVPRQSTGLARRLDLVLMVLVMYIWKAGQKTVNMQKIMFFTVFQRFNKSLYLSKEIFTALTLLARRLK